MKIIELKEIDYKYIPKLYADAFDDKVWEEDWYNIPQMKKSMNYISVEGEVIQGFAISFLLEENTAYLSVLGVGSLWQIGEV